MSTPKKKKRTWAGPLTEHDKKEGPEVFIPSSKPAGDPERITAAFSVTVPDPRIAQLEQKIEGAKIYFREIMAVGRNPACGLAKKALAELES
jgi:hypothetical protein